MPSIEYIISYNLWDELNQPTSPVVSNISGRLVSSGYIGKLNNYLYINLLVFNLGHILIRRYKMILPHYQSINKFTNTIIIILKPIKLRGHPVFHGRVWPMEMVK